MINKVPPQNLDAEKAILGCVLIDSSSLDKIIHQITHNDFYDPKNSIIYECITNLYSKNTPIDLLTLSAELKKRNKFKEIGGNLYLTDLVTDVISAANIKHYLEIVKEASTRRSLITLCSVIEEKSRNENEPLEKVIDEIEQNIVNLSKTNNNIEYFDTSTLLELQMQRADEYARNPDGLRGFSTGIPSIDQLLQGLHRSDLIIVAARPSVGKSALAFNFARHIAVEEKKTVMIFTLEMPAVQVIERMLAQQMKSSLWNIRMGKLTNEEYSKKYPEAAGKLNEANLFIDETPGITINQIRSKSRKLMIEKGLDMIVIDYLQLMQGRDIENRAQAIGEISRSLKILARELNVPIIALSQLNRAIESRTGANKLPQLSDLRESGSIEQDADLVMFLSRENTFDEDTNHDEEIKIDLVVAKHRNGPIGKCSLKFQGKYQLYIDA